jgi:hypothetical protein
VALEEVFLHVLGLFSGSAMAQLVEALRYKPQVSIPDGVIGNFH